jgi:rhomboid protease GluP
VNDPFAAPVPPPPPRPAYLPLPFSRPRWTYILLGLNVAIWLVLVFGGPLGDLLLRNGVKVNALVAQGQYWRLFTAMFLHDYPLPLHLFFNMYALYILGPQIEAAYGATRFLTIYLLSGLAGSVLSYAFGPLLSAGVGASGAIFGLLGAIIAYSYRYRDNLRFGRQQLMNAIGIALINFVLGLSLSAIIDNWAHLGGLIGGVVTGLLLVPHYKVESAGPLAQPTIVDRNSLARQAPAILLCIAVLVAAVWYITQTKI